MKRLIFTLSLLLVSQSIQAKPIIEAYSNGTTINFSVTNNLGDDFLIYVFGVKAESHSALPIEGWISPSGRDINNTGAYEVWSCWRQCNNIPYGGSDILYNNYWINLNLRGIEPGHSEQFQLISNLSSLSWFAFGLSPNQNNYQGDDNFGTKINPGFEGVVNVEMGQPITNKNQAIPEPSIDLLLFIGCLLVKRFIRA